MCIVQLFVRSFDLTSHGLHCSHVPACTHHSELQHPPFRCLSSSLFVSQMEEQQNVPQPKWTTRWNHSCYTGTPLALSSALSSTVTIWCVFHVDHAALVPHTGVERHNAFRSRPQPTAATQACSLPLTGGPHSRCQYTDGHCALCLPHTTLLQQTPLRNSPSRTEHPFRRTGPLRLMKTSVKHRALATQVTRCQPRSPMPPRSSPLLSSSNGASSPKPHRCDPSHQETSILSTV